jgi:hypothetical protein
MNGPRAAPAFHASIPLLPGYTLYRMDEDLSQRRLLTGKLFSEAQFQAHVELLRLFLADREDIVESIDAVLNAQRKPIPYLQDRSLLSRHFEDCFFERTASTAGQARLRGQLDEAHWASGFRPRQLQGLHNDLIHPAEMMIRAFHFWQQTRWPGQAGRTRYAHTLFNVYVIRCLQLLSMRLWDEDASSAGRRLVEIQDLLDELWRSSPADQPVFVRDARWLIPLAQSVPTDDLAAYLEVARQVSETLPEEDALEIQRAHVRMLGGHLTSQIRHHCAKDGVSINDHSLVLRTRSSNALDFALLVQGLVALLKAYDCAVRDEGTSSSDEQMRLQLAGAICQGISADPELFLNRPDLLSAYSMIEPVFIAKDREGHIAYSPMGHRHLQLLHEYGALINRLTPALRDDCPRFRPVEGGCSAYGVVFGYPSTLTELMALKALQRDAETRFSLEDVFNDADTSAAKLAWVDGLRKLPHIDPEVQRLYDYPQQFALDIYDRIEREIRRRDSNAEACDGFRTGRLYIVSEDNAKPDSEAPPIPELPPQYFASSDRQIVAARGIEQYDRAQLLHARQEGHFLVSYETPGGWMAVQKDLLTEVLGAGCDASIAGLPLDAAQVLRLMCLHLAIAPRSEKADL